jgi:hypothetical protein
MRLELEPEETREVLDAILDCLIEEAGFPTADLATIKRWRSEKMKTGSEAMRELTAKTNSDLAKVISAKAKSAVRKPDWS